MTQPKTYSQQQWTDQEFIADGFVAYRPVKRISMMRMMQVKPVPEVFEDIADADAEGETAPAPIPVIPKPTYYWSSYRMGTAVKSAEDDFDPRPIEPQVFAENYRHWEDPNWEPNPSERHLQRMGCMPYYKIAPIWAKKLTDETWVLSKGMAEPTLVPVGDWLCIGKDGEPWTMTEDKFQADYVLPSGKHSAR